MFRHYGPYAMGIPRRRLPPDIGLFRRERMMRHMYMQDEIARLEHESMVMADMLDADPYTGMSGQMYPTPRMPQRPRRPIFPMAQQPAMNWSSRSIRDTIRKTQQRLAAKETATASAEANQASSNKQVNGESAANSEIPPEPIAIGPKIPAKQMWESSYRDLVSEEQESLSLSHSVKESPKQNLQPSKNKKKPNFRNKKYNPYLKKKGKGKTNNTVKKGIGDEFPKKCQVCDTELKDEETQHKETEQHKQNVTKFVTGNNEKALNETVEKLNESTPIPINTPECTQWGEDSGDRTLNTVHFCRLCSVRMTSLQHATQHYAGKSHAKKIRIAQHGHRPYRKPFKPTHFVSGGVLGMQATSTTLNFPLPRYGYGSTPQPTTSYVQPTTATYQTPTDSLAAPGTTTINLKPCLPGDFANSMTPSGQYYCPICNVLIEHAGQLSSHLNSKSHKHAKAMTS